MFTKILTFSICLTSACSIFAMNPPPNEDFLAVPRTSHTPPSFSSNSCRGDSDTSIPSFTLTSSAQAGVGIESEDSPPLTLVSRGAQLEEVDWEASDEEEQGASFASEPCGKEKPLGQEFNLLQFVEQDESDMGFEDLEGLGEKVQAIRQKFLNTGHYTPPLEEALSEGEDSWGSDLSSEWPEEEQKRIHDEEVRGLQKAAQQQHGISFEMRMRLLDLFARGEFEQVYAITSRLNLDWEVRCSTLWGIYQTICSDIAREDTIAIRPPLEFLLTFLSQKEHYPPALCQLMGYKLSEHPDLEINRIYRLPEVGINYRYIRDVRLEMSDVILETLHSLFQHYDDLGDELFMGGIKQLCVCVKLYADTLTSPSVVYSLFAGELYKAVQREKENALHHNVTRKQTRWAYNEHMLVELLQKFSKKNQIAPPLDFPFVKEARRRLIRSESKIGKALRSVGGDNNSDPYHTM